eukprot:COSAG05_NODE_749_length_7548_cov_9.496442_8_plen_54_part_00
MQRRKKADSRTVGDRPEHDDVDARIETLRAKQEQVRRLKERAVSAGATSPSGP